MKLNGLLLSALLACGVEVIIEAFSLTPLLAQEDIIELVVTEETPTPTTPVYVITAEEIQRQRANSVAEVLRGLPGFAINDVGFGADIHTGTYYRGHSINQSVFLLNGRPIGNDISTYHGTTDLNSIPVDAIERIELSSGSSATLYGSQAFGGIVNIITKQGLVVPQLNSGIEYGSYGHSRYRVSYSGGEDHLTYRLGYEQYNADNRYPVPEGAANRDADGLLFNGDSAINNYNGSLSYILNERNTLSLDLFQTTSRRGLLYFGFPLQRDRLDHDLLNIGLSWQAQLGNGDDSRLQTTLSYNQDNFYTYGPTQNTFFRTGRLNSRSLNARVEHDWRFNASNRLQWGVDLQNSFLDGEAFSDIPARIGLNETENRDRFSTSLFALNTWQINPNLITELGIRQNFNSEFGSYLNPSFGTRFALTPTIALRGSWVRAQRNPGLDQLYVYDSVHNWLPNSNLQSETGSSWTAGVDVALTPTLSTQLAYFGSSLNNRLAIDAGRWENIGLVNTNGLEMALRWQATPSWSTFLNYTYTDARIATGAQQGLQLGLIPYSVAQLGIGYQNQGWQVNLYGSYNSGSRRAFFTLPGQTTTDFSPSWFNLDLSARVPVTQNIGLLLYLENLADVQYEKTNRTYQPGLTFRVGLQSNF